MNSRLLNPAPFTGIELPCLTICLTQEELEQEVDRHITNELLSHRFYQRVNTVEPGDIVTGVLDEKELLITVDSGLFDVKLENALLGKHVGETAETDTLAIKVEKIERLVIPSLCDAWVKSLNLEEVATVYEYRTYLENFYRNFYLENYLLYFAMEFFLNWMQASEWQWDEEELSALFKEYRAMEKRYLDAHDTFIDESEEELEEASRENMMEAIGYYLYLQYIDFESAPAVLQFETQEAIETLRSLALRPMIDFLKDKVIFTDTEVES